VLELELTVDMLFFLLVCAPISDILANGWVFASSKNNKEATWEQASPKPGLQ